MLRVREQSIVRYEITGEPYELLVMEETDVDRPSAGGYDPWRSRQVVTRDIVGEDGRWVGRAAFDEADYERQADVLPRVPLIKRYNQWSRNAAGEPTAVQRRMPTADAFSFGYEVEVYDVDRLVELAAEVARRGGSSFLVGGCSKGVSPETTATILQHVVDCTRLTIHQAEGRIDTVPAEGEGLDEIHLDFDELGDPTGFRTFTPDAGVPAPTAGSEEQVSVPPGVVPKYPWRQHGS